MGASVAIFSLSLSPQTPRTKGLQRKAFLTWSKFCFAVTQFQPPRGAGFQGAEVVRVIPWSSDWGAIAHVPEP